MADKANISLIGPVSPYRGGIAQYTTQLHRALAKRARLQTISFKRQYPGRLYPGDSDIEPGSAGHKESAVDYSIDVYSPLSWRRTTRKIIDSGCDLAVFDWWTLFWQPGFAYMSRRLRRHGVKTAFLCHNLFDHDTKGLKRKLSERMLGQADAYIVQSKEQEEVLQALYPKARILLRVHPIYAQFPKPAKHWPKRGRLELLFFGFIRPYKGLDVLVEALAQLKDKDVYLTVVGEPWGKVDELKSRLTDLGAPNLELHLEYVNDQEAANYFERADVVALPYLSATGSGVATLAYNYSKPILASSVGGLRDVVREGQTGWLVAAGSPKDLAGQISKITRPKARAMAPAIAEFCRHNSWDGMAAAITEFALDLSGGTSA